MSIVGPQARLVSDGLRFARGQFHRYDVLPGITGLRQVQMRQDSSFEQNFLQLDDAYIENWSLWASVVRHTDRRLFSAA